MTRKKVVSKVTKKKKFTTLLSQKSKESQSMIKYHYQM